MPRNEDMAYLAIRADLARAANLGGNGRNREAAEVLDHAANRVERPAGRYRLAAVTAPSAAGATTEGEQHGE